jgi:hypothetical protein
MKFDLMSLEIDVLNRLYKAKEKELEEAILRGTSWEEVTIRRKAFLELSSALHIKLINEGEGQVSLFPTRPDGEEQ